MNDTTVLITGATDGLGRATAHHLAEAQVRLILHGRSEPKVTALADDLATVGDAGRPLTVVADFAELAQVRRLADEVSRLTGRLDVLVNNAGIGGGEPDGTERRESADGYELRFAVNYLASFLLTNQLLPLLEASAPARIVYVASLAQAPIDFDDVMLTREYSGAQAYAQSKLAMIIAGFELASRLEPTRVTVNSLHPGTYMPTKMVVQSIGRTVDTLETGVESVTNLVASPALAGVSGCFFDRMREARANETAYDPAVRERLWNLSVDLTAEPM